MRRGIFRPNPVVVYRTPRRLLTSPVGGGAPAGSYVGGAQNGGNVATLTGATGLSWPAGVASGDVAVLVVTGQDAFTFTTPTGFTLVATLDDPSARSAVYKKVCAGTETGEIGNLGMSGINRITATLGVRRGYSDVAGAVGQAEAGTATFHSCPQITSGSGAAAGDSIMVAASERLTTGTTNGTPPTGFTERQEFGTGGTGGTYTQQADDGLTTAVVLPYTPPDFTGFVSGSAVVTWTIALRPTGGGAGGDQSPTFTDSSGLTDAAFLTWSLAPTDSVGLSDAAELTQSHVITDSAGLTDSALIASGKTVDLTDSAGLVDAAVFDQAKVLTDSAGLTDAAALTVSPILTDSAGLTDTATAQSSKLVTQTDSAGLTDAAEFIQAKVLTDSAGLTDTASLTQSTAPTDSAGLTDTLIIASGKTVDQTDSAGLTDSQTFSQAKVLTDSAGLTDAAGLTVGKTITDSAGLTDSASVGLQQQATATDSAGLTDAAVLFRAAVLTDLVGLADATAFSQLRILTDSAGLTDAAEASNYFPITFRPNTGSTARPSSGRTSRPNDGITARP